MKPGDRMVWCRLYRGTPKEKRWVEIIKVHKVRTLVKVIETGKIMQVEIESLKPDWGHK